MILVLTGCGATTTASRVVSKPARPAAPRATDRSTPSTAVATSTPIRSMQEQERVARRIIARDRALKALLGSDRYRIVQIGAWFGASSREITGAVARLRLQKPLTTTGFVPIVVYAPDGSHYREYRTHKAFHGVTRLSVSVSSRARRIVQVLPEDGAERGLSSPVAQGEGP